MTPSPVSLAYRRAALQQASTVGLVIALHDTLAGNISRAAAALEKSDIEARCRELTHGFKVLQQLDAMLDMKNGGQAAINIRRFYTHLRGQMLVAQFKLSPAVLHEQVRLVLEIRGAWQQVDSRGGQPPSPAKLLAEPPQLLVGTQAASQVGERQSFSCSG